jgi:hypothetical protein
MSEYYNSGRASREPRTTDVAREEAGNVSENVTHAAGEVARTTKEQAREITIEAGRQARDLLAEARDQAREQAGKQRERAVSGLRALGDELDRMAERGEQAGLATEVARQLSSRTRDLARFIDQREPGDLLEEARSFARRRSGLFLVATALAGVAVGRLTRAAAAQSRGPQQAPSAATSSGLPPSGAGAPAATSGQPLHPAATPDGPAHSAAAVGGSTVGEPAYGEPAYGQAPQREQGRTL